MYDYQPQYLALYLKRDSYASYSSEDWGFRPDGSEDFSLTIWFWPDNANARLLDGENVMTLDLLEDKLVFWLKGYSDLVCVADRYPLLRHEWNHVTITYRHIGQIFFYVNGIQTTAYSIYQDTSAKMWDCIRFGSGLEGYLRSVQFFNQFLSDEEVDRVKRAVEDAPKPVRWFDFTASTPQERVTESPIVLTEGAKIYALGDGLFCDAGQGLFPLDGDSVNPGAYQDAPYTVQAWISIYSQEQTFAILFMNGRHTIDSGMVLYLEKDGSGYRLCAGRGAHTREENILRSYNTISCRSWHNVAVTYDGADMNLYIDGALEGTKKKSEMTPFTEQMNFGILRIGNDDLPGLSNTEGCFHGAFGNIAVWDRALTTADLNKYANNPPCGDEAGLVANYTFSRYACCNLVNGFEVSTAGVDTSKICRNPIPTPSAPIKTPTPNQMPEIKAIPHLNGKSAQDLHRERANALPDAQVILKAILGETCHPAQDKILAEIQQELALRCTETITRPFYLSQPLEDGTYQFYLISDQIYPAGVIAPRGRNEFVVWLIQLVSTIVIDVLSIYCAVPKDAGPKFPEAFSKSLLNDRAKELFKHIQDTSIKNIVAMVCKFLLNGGLLMHIVDQFRRDGIWLLSANLVTLATSFLVKASTAWGWMMVVVRIAFLMVDVYRLYQEMPKLVGAELIQLRFSSGNVFVPAVSALGASLTPHWKDGQSLDDASPVVCCLRQAKGGKITVSAQFSVYTNGTYQITTMDISGFPLGKIEESAVLLKAGKDGTCTVSLTFKHDSLEKSTIGAFTPTLSWTIRTSTSTVTQETSIRLFLIYDFPKTPWGEKSGFSTPWTDILTVACKLATGITGETDVQWQHLLINGVITGLWKNCTGYAEEPVYVSGTNLYLTRWLADLPKRDALTMNAQDCAALLVAICNLLGCDLASVLLNGTDGKPMNTRSVVRIGSNGISQNYELNVHETVMSLRGMVPYFSDPCYQIKENSEQDARPLIMLPFYTEETEMGFSNQLFKEPKVCEIPSDQRKIGNGRRTIL